MFGSATIDIAIGIVFVFLLVSLIASTINEIILSYLNMRGKDLLRGIKTLLNDTDATGLVKKIYEHGQIFGLFEGEFDSKKAGNLPAYIPPQNFVKAFLDVVENPGPEVAAVKQDAEAKFKSLRAAAVSLAGAKATEKVGKPLVAMIDEAGTDLPKLQKSVEDWFNSAMDRVSGWYKYRTQWMLFGIGLVVAVALNIDAIWITKQLSKDSTLRQAVVAAAQSAKQPDSASGKPIEEQIKQAKKEVSDMQNLGIPLGWTDESPNFTGWAWVQVLLGWLMTAVAASLGAPFWFDILNKIMVVRSTVKPREKSQEEGSKEPQNPKPKPDEPPK